MLTDTKLRGLKPQDKPYRVADSGGLCIEVRPSGSRVWRYRYRYAGKASMVTLAEYPAMSLAEARVERERLRSLVKGGANPAQVAKVERASRMHEAGTTFGSVATELLQKRANEGLSAGSVQRESRLIEKDLGELFDFPIADLTAPVILSALRKLERRGVVETAHRARSLCSRVFRYAIATGRATTNPADSLVGALEQSRTKHFPSITDPQRVGQLLRDIHSYRGSPITQAALKLAPLVFVRPGELRHALKADINLDDCEWRFTTSKTGTPHIVPLSRQAVEVLREVMPYTGKSEYVFPGIRSNKRPISENTLNAALRYMGYDQSTMTSHGFRAMARTILDEVLGYRPDYIEKQLAHAVRDPLGRAYNRTAHLAERKKMMQAWADYLDQLRHAESVET